ncbi:MAG: tetratricopeptide repeat protein [bacterium]|nr:tetratricopeptide repeat protein [Candidatus Limimorpha caballi]
MRRFFHIASLFALTLLVGCGPDPEKSRAYFNEGLDYHYACQYEEAIEQFQKAIKTDGGNFEAYYYLGCSYMNLSQKEDALNCWMKSVEIKPDFADGYFNIGLYHRLNNDRDMACYYFKLAEKFGRNSMQDYTKFCD